MAPCVWYRNLQHSAEIYLLVVFHIQLFDHLSSLGSPWILPINDRWDPGQSLTLALTLLSHWTMVADIGQTNSCFCSRHFVRKGKKSPDLRMTAKKSIAIDYWALADWTDRGKNAKKRLLQNESEWDESWMELCRDLFFQLIDVELKRNLNRGMCLHKLYSIYFSKKIYQRTKSP